MPVRGENVGTAYVRILADGRDLPNSIRDELDDTDDDFERSGERLGRAHAKGVRSGLKKDQPKTQAEVRKLFEIKGRNADRLVKQMTGPVFRGIEDQVRRWHGDRVGEQMIRDIRRGFIEGGGFEQWGDDFKRLFDRMPVLARNATNRIIAEENRLDAEREKDARVYEQRQRQLDSVLLGLAKDRVKRSKALQKEEVRDWDKAFADLSESAAANARETEREWRNSFARMEAAVDRLRRGVGNSSEGINESLDHTIGHVRELRSQMDRIDMDRFERKQFAKVFDDTDRALVRLNPRFRQFNGALERMTPRIGRAFGRGARNDLVNFVGAGVEGITRLAFAIPRAAEGLTSLGRGFMDAFRNTSETASMASRLSTAFGSMGGSAGSLGGSLAALVPSLMAIAIAIPIVVAVVGTIIAALSMLLGTIVALASTIYFSLIAALGALAGALAPVALGVGVLAGAIMSMSDAQKAALKTAIRPFVDGMKEMGREAANIIFGGRQFTNTIGHMTKALTSSNMRGLVRNIAQAIGDVGNQWAASLNSPGFQRWVRVMSKTMPDQIRGLGRVMSNVVSGMGGTLIALQPTVDRFVGWLERITGEWAAWAQSKKGQREMLDFFDRAVESAKSLGDFLGELSGLIHDLFTGGQETGDNLFDSMADSIARFREYIADGGLEKWFKDAEQFAKTLGDTLAGLGKVLDALDNSFTRFLAGSAIAQLGAVMWVLEQAFNGALSPINLFREGLSKLGDIDFSAIGSKLEGLGSTIKSGLGTALEVVTAWPRQVAETLMNGFNSLFGGGGEGGGVNFAQIGMNIITSLGSAIVSAAPGLLGPVGTLALQFVTGFVQGLANSGFGQMVIGFFTQTIPSIASAVGQTALSIGTSIINSIASGIRSGWGAVSSLASQIGSTLSNAFNTARSKAGEFASAMQGRFSSAVSAARGRAGELAAEARSRLGSAFDTARSKGASLASSLSGRFSSAMGSARSAGQRLGSLLGGALAGGANAARSAISAVGDAASWIKGQLENLIDVARRVGNALSNIKMPSIGGALGGLWPFASGGLVSGPTRALVGEAGPEAIVPLNRPLSQVDPAVRALSAIAQGKGIGSNSYSTDRRVNVTVGDIVTPTRNPRAVATEVVNEIVGAFT